MQADAVARDVDQRLVDRRHHALDEIQEIRERPLRIGDVTFEPEIGRVDLQQMNPFATIVSYSICSARPSAAR